MVEVEREIVRHDAAVDVAQQPLVARAEENAVVRDVGIDALHPEMDDEQRRPAFACEAFRDLRPAPMVQQIAVAVHQVAVGCDHLGGAMPAAACRHPGRAVARDLDPRHRIAEPDRPAGAARTAVPAPPPARWSRRAHTRRRHPSRSYGSAHRSRSSSSDCRRRAGYGTTAPAAAARPPHRRTRPIDAAPRPIFHQRGCGADHRRKIEEGDRAELHIALLVNPLRIGEEAVVARHVGQVENSRSRPTSAPRRSNSRSATRRASRAGRGHHGDEVDVGGHVLSAERP